MNGSAFKIMALLLICGVVAVLIRNYKSEFSIVFIIQAVAVLMFYIAKNVFPAIKTVKDIFEKSSGNFFAFTVVIKALIISYIAEFCSDILTDFGQTSLSKGALLVGKCAVFILCVPLINEILKIAVKFIEL